MLKELQDVLNETLEGYKGGGFIMHEKVDVYMAFLFVQYCFIHKPREVQND